MKPHAAALAALFTLLACARGLPAPVAAPPPPPPAAAPVADDGAAAAAATGAAQTAAPPVPATPALPAPAPPIPGRVRVGLATDLAELVLPCCDTRLALRAGSRRLDLSRTVRIEPRVTATAEPVFRLQAAALRSETQATVLARRLAGLLGGAAGEVVFDARDGLYRVRLGRYSTRAEAESAAARLRRRGVDGAWVVSEPPRLENPALAVTHGEGSWVVPGRWLEIVATAGGGDGIPLAGKRYRGELLVFLNDRGSLNLINRLTLDDYLRGVVPREMGPEIYGDLEALKAQAVAARTYTLRNLGEFRAEGYDICATPRCQVYGGIDAEHALSDRAVSETAGEVLLAHDDFADALYSSTCGGHTENVEVVFPSKRHAYLRGVPCLESGQLRLAGNTETEAIEAAVLARLLPGAAETDAAGFGARLGRLAELAGLEATDEPPPSLDRRRVHAYLGRLLSLVPAEPAAAGGARGSVAGRGGAEVEDPRLAARLREAGLMESRSSSLLDPAEARRVLFRLAIYLGLVERADGRYLIVRDGRLRIKAHGAERSWAVDVGVATFRFAGGAPRPAPLTLVAGDGVSVYAAGDRLLVLAQRSDLTGAELEGPARRRSWRYFRSDRELERLVDSRFPGLGFRHLEIVSRGVSGRVAKLRLTGRDGETVEVSGLPIRWLLDLPDTRFTAERTTSAGGAPGWLFAGSGWGHGVGMCQVGAFGMARRGHRYADILDHYYTGLELRRLAGASPPAPAPAAAF